MTDTIRTSKLLQEIISGRDENDRMSVKDITNLLHERGFGLILILFSFPMAIPLPYPPGFTTILGIPLVFFAVQMILRRQNAWLPEAVGKKTIKVSHLKFAIEKSTKIFKLFEKIMKPRMEFMTGLSGERVIGFLTLLCAICIALPIPLGNAIPSLGIFVMSIGLLNKDGLIVALGMAISIIGIVISFIVVWLITFFGISALKKALSEFLPVLNVFL